MCSLRKLEYAYNPWAAGVQLPPTSCRLQAAHSSPGLAAQELVGKRLHALGTPLCTQER